ncbi:hypothetical protein MRX96_020536 [Rhipicephalus microplus]
MISESDHDALPEGWRRRVCQRTKGRSAGRCDVYLYTPSGQRLRSRREVAAFLRISLIDPASALQLEAAAQRDAVGKHRCAW